MVQPRWTFRDKGHYTAQGRWQTGTPKHMRHAWIWPKDQPRTRLGRLRDIVTGKGPDMYVASNPNRAVHASDGPSRARWTGFPTTDTPDAQAADANAFYGGMPWTRGRERRAYFDFDRRRYVRRPFDGMVMDARFMPHSNLYSFVTRYPNPHLMQPVAGDPRAPRAYDPRNWGQGGVAYGRNGRGGDYFPPVDGYPRW